MLSEQFSLFNALGNINILDILHQSLRPNIWYIKGTTPNAIPQHQNYH